MRKPGRPKGSGSSGVDKREVISNAARRSFSKLGFEKTTIRLIAAEAKVDPKLVMHYFESKERLFAETLTLPFEPNEVAKALAVVPVDSWGKVMSRLLYSKSPLGRPIETLEGVIRAAASQDGAADTLREFYKNNLIKVFQELNLDNPSAKAVAVSSVLVGFVFTERVLNIQDLTETTKAQRRDMLSKLIQAALY
jgi:AcrR family transcriptional regulator